MAHTVYVTGTDTGAGKSIASAALLHAYAARGVCAAGMKPVASGCEVTAQGLRNEDALLLQVASGVSAPYGVVNPYAFEPPVAPEFAAREAGVEVALAPILQAHAQLAGHPLVQVVVVEGVGGWMAPLSATLDQSDVARAVGADVVLVIGLRLGCISHARLTARAIQADGFRLAGWIGSTLDPDMPRLAENIDALRARIDAPCLGVLPYRGDADPRAMQAALALPAPTG